MGRVKMRDMQMWHKIAGIENAAQGPMESHSMGNPTSSYYHHLAMLQQQISDKLTRAHQEDEIPERDVTYHLISVYPNVTELRHTCTSGIFL